jgi:hypothetical protein
METLRTQFGAAESLFRHQPLASAAVATGAAALLPLLVVAFRDYRLYVSLGPHGMPDNFYGWCKQLTFTLVSRKDTTATAPYDLAVAAAREGPNSTRSFFSSATKGGELTVETLPQRRPAEGGGARPEIPGFVAPQRQVTERATDTMKARMNAHLDELVRLNSSVLQRELSNLEGPVPAVQLRVQKDGAGEGVAAACVPPPLRFTRGEFTHIHPPDGSTHVVLSLVDSARVIERGWGLRHRMAGSVITWGYTLIYAPLDDEDLAIWKDIVAAAARYATADIGEVRVPA